MGSLEAGMGSARKGPKESFLSRASLLHRSLAAVCLVLVVVIAGENSDRVVEQTVIIVPSRVV